jgi:hypothetical protein
LRAQIKFDQFALAKKAPMLQFSGKITAHQDAIVFGEANIHGILM